jgi:hypothetical protein
MSLLELRARGLVQSAVFCFSSSCASRWQSFHGEMTGRMSEVKA